MISPHHLMLLLLLIASSALQAAPSRTFITETTVIKKDQTLGIDLVDTVSADHQIRLAALNGELLLNPNGGYYGSQISMAYKTSWDMLGLLLNTSLDSSAGMDQEFYTAVLFSFREDLFDLNGNLAYGREHFVDLAARRNSRDYFNLAASFFVKAQSFQAGMDLHLSNRKGTALGLLMGLRWLVRDNISMDFIVYEKTTAENDTDGRFKTPAHLRLNAEF